MANVLNVTPALHHNVALEGFPTLAELTVNTPTIEVNLSDFYQLQHCQLATLVAERNTVLGKLQLPSTRFVYETHLLQQLKQCIAQTQQPALLAKLSIWLEAKQNNYVNTWVDLLQKSHETKIAFSSNAGYLSRDNQNGINQTVQALTYLLASYDNQNAESETLELHLKNLATFALPAKMWRSQALLSENLNNTTKWLNELAITNICHHPMSASNSQKLRYLHNVFQLFFIEKIQVIATQLNNYHYRLTPLIDSMTINPHFSPSFSYYLKQQNDAHFLVYQQAMQTHINFWQTLFKSCHIKPGQH